MAEQISYWVCKCGTANAKSNKVCTSCESRKSKKSIWIAAGVVSIIVALSLSPSNQVPEKQLVYSEAQAEFISKIKATSKAYKSAENDLVKMQLLLERDQLLTQNTIQINGWIGEVISVQPSQNKAAIAVRYENFDLVAGENLTYGVTTLISKESELYTQLFQLRKGDKVKIWGRPAMAEDKLLELSYSKSNSAKHPKFLFKFEKLMIIGTEGN